MSTVIGHIWRCSWSSHEISDSRGRIWWDLPPRWTWPRNRSPGTGVEPILVASHLTNGRWPKNTDGKVTNRWRKSRSPCSTFESLFVWLSRILIGCFEIAVIGWLILTKFEVLEQSWCTQISSHWWEWHRSDTQRQGCSCSRSEEENRNGYKKIQISLLKISICIYLDLYKSRYFTTIRLTDLYSITDIACSDFQHKLSLFAFD